VIQFKEIFNMNAMTTPLPVTDLQGKPWWREAYVWLVIGGPLAVIVAGFVTAYIAVSNPDPVLDQSNYKKAAVERAQTDGVLTTAELASLQPAQKGRNHAAAPAIPKQAAD
jgi:uncharacterized protein